MAQEETVLADPSELDSAAVGQEFNGADYALLVALGIVAPALLLLWGWL